MGRSNRLVVPDASSDSSDATQAGDAGMRGDGAGRMRQSHRSAGGRAVAGSNPVSPILESRRGKRLEGIPEWRVDAERADVVLAAVPRCNESARSSTSSR